MEEGEGFAGMEIGVQLVCVVNQFFMVFHFYFNIRLCLVAVCMSAVPKNIQVGTKEPNFKKIC